MIKHFLLTLLACLAIASCSAFDDDYFAEHQSKTPELVSNKFQVHQKSAEYFAHKVSFDDNVTRSVSSVEPIAYGKDTLLYVVNFSNNNGWIVLSGDKRTEAILASAQTGHFNKRNLGGSAVWMNELANNIYGIKQSNPQDTTTGAYTSWLNIDTLALGLKKPYATRADNYNPNPDGQPGYGNHHFDPSDPNQAEDILVDTQIKITYEKEVDHLIETHWGQGDPWNVYTPIWTITNKHCPTGCAAVAGAQMLYYFHFKKGKPATANTAVRGYGLAWDGGYDLRYQFLNPSLKVWDKMLKQDYIGMVLDTSTTNPVAILMLQVGINLNMEYTEKKSGAYTKDMPKMFRAFGIDCDLVNYNPQLIRESLDNGMPVNINAAAEEKKFNFLFITFKSQPINGHSWIIDGYKDQTVVYTYTYNRRPKQIIPPEYQEEGGEYDNTTSQNEFHYQDHPKFGIFTVKNTYHNYYWKMNLGWYGQGDNGQYLTEESAIWDTPNKSYQYKKEIVCNFRF